jgi:hypothetical protein
MLQYDTREHLAANWGANVAEIRQEARNKAEAIYETWLASDMSIVERDRRTVAVQAWMDAAIEAERKAWYHGLSQLAA